jgi:hypothetical protein
VDTPAAGACIAGRYRLAGEGHLLPSGIQLVRAHDLVLRRAVLLKLVTGLAPVPDAAAGDAADPRVAALFGDARLLSRHVHPATARIYDLGHATGVAYVVQQWIEGPTLAVALRRRGAFSPGDAVVLLQQLCAIPAPLLAGLRPAAIVLDAGGRPVLIATSVLGGGAVAPRTGPAGAVRALGALLDELLTGHGAAPGGPAGAPPTAPVRRTAVPAGLDAIVGRARSAEAAAYYPDSASFGRALAPFARGAAWERPGQSLTPSRGHLSSRSTPPAFPAGPLRRPPLRRLRALVAGLGIVGLLCGAWAVAAVTGSPASSPATRGPRPPSLSSPHAPAPRRDTWRYDRRAAPAGVSSVPRPAALPRDVAYQP